MVKPGGKHSRSVLFEDVDIGLWKESGDKCFSFTTNAENLPFWITGLNNIYKSKDTDIIWSLTKQSGKLMAQIQESLGEDQATTKRNSNLLCISFFTSTQRILLQGNYCLKWYEKYFANLKEDVYKRKQDTTGTCNLKKLIKNLVENESEENDDEIETSMCTEAESEKIQHVADKDLILEPAKSQVEDRLPEFYLTPTKSRRRSLPESPSESHEDLILINSLKLTISKLVKENVELKSNLHNVTVETTQLRSENETRKLEISDLTTIVKDLKFNLQQLNEKTETNNIIMNREETEENNNKKFHELKKSMESLNSDVNSLFTRSRHGEELSDEMKDKQETINSTTLILKNDIAELKSRIINLEENANSIQEVIFTGEDVVNHKRRTLDVTDEDRSADHNQPRMYREIKRNGKNTVLVYGDSNTKGLDKNKLNTDINSLSGATIDSVILHLKESTRKADESVKGIIFHLGTNNMSTNSTDILKNKINSLHEIASKQFPKATIGMCQIPKQHAADINDKISEINDFIYKQKNLHLIRVFCEDKHFQRDGIHYNKHGLAILAINIKKWIIKNNLDKSTHIHRHQHDYQERRNVSSPVHQRNENPWQNWNMQWPQMWNGFTTNSLR